jgi:hypothetical protein
MMRGEHARPLEPGLSIIPRETAPGLSHAAHRAPQDPDGSEKRLYKDTLRTPERGQGNPFF